MDSISNSNNPNMHKSAINVAIFSISVCFGSFFFGFNVVAFNPYQSEVSTDGEWSNPLLFISMATAAFPLGAVFGCLIGGKATDEYGRRKSLIYCDYFSMIATLICMNSNFLFFFTGKFLIGICVGINSTIIPTYVQEICPKEIYGVIGSIHCCMIGTGLIAVFLLKSFGFSWKFVTFLPLLISFSRATLLTGPYSNMESPSYNVGKGHLEEAVSCLTTIYKEQYVVMVLDEIKVHTRDAGDLKQITTKKLFEPNNIRRLQTGVTLHILQQFSGINAINFYSSAIFKQDPNLTEAQANSAAITFSICVGFIIAITGALSGVFIDKFGAKKTLFVGDLFSAIFLLILAIFGFMGVTKYNTMLILSFMIAYGISLGSVVWSYVPEILPPKGCTLAVLSNWFSAFLIGLSFPIFCKLISLPGCFLFFSFMCFSGLVFIQNFVHDTKNLSKAQIERLFRTFNSNEDQLE